MVDGHERHCHQDQVRSRSVDLTIEQPVETKTPVPLASVTEQDLPPVPNQEIAPEFAVGAYTKVICSENLSCVNTYCSTMV